MEGGIIGVGGVTAAGSDGLGGARGFGEEGQLDGARRMEGGIIGVGGVTAAGSDGLEGAEGGGELVGDFGGVGEECAGGFRARLAESPAEGDDEARDAIPRLS